MNTAQSKESPAWVGLLWFGVIVVGVIAFFAYGLFSIWQDGLDQRSHTTIQNVQGTVQNIRITEEKNAVIQKSSDGSVTGAAVGLAVAGPVGAVVGSLAGSDDKPHSGLLGCTVEIRIPEKSLQYTFVGPSEEDDIARCSLLRLGDRIAVTRTQYKTEPPTFSINHLDRIP